MPFTSLNKSQYNNNRDGNAIKIIFGLNIKTDNAKKKTKNNL
jgi:hypothetical protein